MHRQSKRQPQCNGWMECCTACRAFSLRKLFTVPSPIIYFQFHLRHHQQGIKFPVFLILSVDGGRSSQKIIWTTQNQFERGLNIPKLNKAIYPKAKTSSKVRTKLQVQKSWVKLQSRLPGRRCLMEKSEPFPPLLLSPACAAQLRPDPGHSKPQELEAEAGLLRGWVQLLFAPELFVCIIQLCRSLHWTWIWRPHKTQINIPVLWKESHPSPGFLYIPLRLQSPLTKIKLCFNFGFNGETHEKVQEKTKTTRNE